LSPGWVRVILGSAIAGRGVEQGGVVEHRWGRRISVRIPVRLIPDFGDPIIGETQNISFSGALVQTARSVRLGSHVQIELILPDELGTPPERVAAHVIRKMGARAALEWCEFAPHAVRTLLLALDPATPGRADRHASAKT
jgi:PilZ domain